MKLPKTRRLISGRGPVYLLIFALCGVVMSCAAGSRQSIVDHNAVTQVYELKSGGSVELVSAPFDRRSHKLGNTILNGDGQDTIDGAPIYGTDGGWPQTKVLRGAVRFPDGRRVPLDVAGMYEPDSPGTHDPKFSMEFDGQDGVYILKGHFSDGAGSYDAEWMGQDDRSVRLEIRSDCGAWGGEMSGPERPQLQADLPSESRDCEIDDVSWWGYRNGHLDMVVRVRCGDGNRQHVLRYQRVGDGWNWRLDPRPNPFHPQ